MQDEFKKYIDKDGLFCIDTDGNSGISTQNGVLFTMQYLFCLLASNENEIIKTKEIERIKEVLKKLEIKSGLSVRFYGSTEFESMDNTCAWLTFSALFDDGQFANRMFIHGQKTFADGIDETQDKEKNEKYYNYAKWFNILTFGKVKNFWNNQNSNKFCFQGWFGRSPAMLGLLKMTSGRWCNPLLWISVLIGQFVGAFNNVNDCDARTLPFINWQYLKNRSFFWNIAYKIWCKILIKYYPNGIKDVYLMYYKDKGENTNPLIKYSQPY